MEHLRSITAAVLLALAASASPAFAQARTTSAAEQANLKVVSDWWREVLQAGHVELAEKYMAEDYLQHNPNINTGRAAFVQVFSRRPSRDIKPALDPAPVIQFAKGPYVVLDRKSTRVSIRKHSAAVHAMPALQLATSNLAMRCALAA